MSKYILNETYFDITKKKPSLYAGEFIKLIHDNIIEMIFKDNKKSLKITTEQYNDLETKLLISQPKPLTDNDNYEFYHDKLKFNKYYNKKALEIIFGDNIESKDFKTIQYLLDKNIQDAYTTAGYTRCLNVEDHKLINNQLNQGISKNNMKEKNKHCGPIFNRRPRNCTNIYTQHEEESFLRNNDNFGRLPQGIKKHEAASLKESNGILLKGLSFISRLKDIDTKQNLEHRDILFKNYLDYNLELNHINKDVYEYINNYHSSNKYVIDFLIHKPISIDDINDQKYCSKEHSINFCHIIPWKGTTVKNCSYGLTRYNRLQSDISKFQLLLLYKEDDGDVRRKELIDLILEYDPNLKQIFESKDYIIKLKTYLESQYY